VAESPDLLICAKKRMIAGLMSQATDIGVYQAPFPSLQAINAGQ
jgi:hypothetical protein